MTDPTSTETETLSEAEALELARMEAMHAWAFAEGHVEAGDDMPESTKYDDAAFDSVGGMDFLILTDDEANERCKAQILEDAWAFQKEFLNAHTGKVDLCGRAGEAFDKMRAELCEDANDFVLALIPDHDHFATDAMRVDGRGHFLSGYDGEEIEFRHNGRRWYLYRTN